MDMDAVITRALRESGLPEHLSPLVKTLHEQPDEGWRVCCKSDCRPCVTDLARAVDRLRELIRSDG